MEQNVNKLLLLTLELNQKLFNVGLVALEGMELVTNIVAGFGLGLFDGTRGVDRF
jgi:hypothetical protein